MSGRKNHLEPFQVITNGDMSADIVSSITNIKGLDNIGYALTFTGAPVGIFSVEISADYSPGASPYAPPANAGNWVTITLSVPVVAAGAPNSAYIDITEISAPYIRLRYTATSGTGSVNALVVAKAV